MRVNNIVSFKGLKVNALYYNDSHGQVKNIVPFLNARDTYYSSHKDNINLTLSGGDIFVDTSRHNDIVAERLASKTDAVVVGNHDLDGGGKYLCSLIKKHKLFGKFLGINLSLGDEESNSIIQPSKVIEQNGEKIGVIGVAPFDFGELTFITDVNKDDKVKGLDSTVKLVSDEVKKLESAGINKIFLLAHTGESDKNNCNYYDIFSKIGGIDVIIGGHDHREDDRYAISDRGEPVKIVATGKNDTHSFGENLDYYGILNLDFDDNGVLIPTECSNTFVKIDQNEASGVGESKVIYTLPEPLIKANPLAEHSEIGNIIADSNLWYVNEHTSGEKAEFAFVNSGTIRDNFNETDVTEEKIICTVPFNSSKLIKTKLTKKQIINTLTHCAKSSALAKIVPGVMQVSGMEYTINPDLTVKDVHILNDDGSVKFDLADFNDDDNFTCVYDDFLATGVAGLVDLKKDESDYENYGVSRQDAMIEYLSNAHKLYDYKQVRIKK